MDNDFLFDVWHLFVRALKKTIRTPIVIISALALPVLFWFSSRKILRSLETSRDSLPAAMSNSQWLASLL